MGPTSLACTTTTNSSSRATQMGTWPPSTTHSCRPTPPPTTSKASIQRTRAQTGTSTMATISLDGSLSHSRQHHKDCCSSRGLIYRCESTTVRWGSPQTQMGGRRAGGGSIDTLSTNDGDNVSINSYGSTGSFNSTAPINNPMRSSLKKPKNKETASVASAASKKSVTIALGEEQTAV